jgi:hypothetical protein
MAVGAVADAAVAYGFSTLQLEIAEGSELLLALLCERTGSE